MAEKTAKEPYYPDHKGSALKPEIVETENDQS